MILTFKRGKKKFIIKIHPQTFQALRRDIYNTWIEQNQKYVDRNSNKRIAYIYMKDMTSKSLRNFIIEMSTEAHYKDAIILDLRYNNGGNVHDQVLNFLSQRPYAKWKIRGGKYTNQPHFAPSAKPIVLLINARSLSDAEMTAAGFKALRLGTIIGTETYRWVIFTNGKSLVDNSFYRMPSIGCYTLNLNDLEKNGVSPDIYVKKTFKDRQEGKYPQLDKAIKVLMEKLK